MACQLESDNHKYAKEYAKTIGDSCAALTHLRLGCYFENEVFLVNHYPALKSIDIMDSLNNNRIFEEFCRQHPFLEEFEWHASLYDEESELINLSALEYLENLRVLKLHLLPTEPDEMVIK